VVAVAGAITVVAGAFGLLHSPLFRVRDITVVGDTHTPRAQVVVAAGLSNGQALMVDAGSVAAIRAVDALPWVSTVTFTRRWPWTVVVRVHERVPAALVTTAAGGTDVVDETGRVLEVLTSSEHAPTLPVVMGAQGAPPGQRVSLAPGIAPSQFDEVLGAAAAAPHALAEQHLEVVRSPSLGLVAYIGVAKTLVLLGNGSQIQMKMAVLAELAARVQLSGYEQVDLTVPGRPALTPVPN
jgi:cell division protein FtsQ